MSVDFSAGIVYGWKLKQARYNELPDEIRDEYGIQTDCYSYDYDGDCFVGIKQYSCYAGESYEIKTDDVALPFEDFSRILTAIPDIIKKHPNPSLYLYGRVS
jgi:hypothetical protein